MKKTFSVLLTFALAATVVVSVSPASLSDSQHQISDKEQTYTPSGLPHRDT